MMSNLMIPPITKFIREKNRVDLANSLNTLSGFEIADLISVKSDEDQVFVLSVLDPDLAAATLDFLSPRVQKRILHRLPPRITGSILSAMAPDDRTALLEELPSKTVSDYLNLLSSQDRDVTLSLLGYPEDSIGRLMTTDYIALERGWVVEQALDYIRIYGRECETTDEVYVIDDSGVLLGAVKLKDLLFSPKGSKLNQIVDRNISRLSVSDRTEKAIEVFKKDGHTVLPVTDDAGIMLGVVTIDDILHLISEKNSERMQKIGGMEALEEPYLQTPFFDLIKKRARWLVLLFLGEMFTATAMGYFEMEISKAVVLALFLPLIISSGGNAGSQSTTLIIRAMALGEVKLKDCWKVMRREVFSGAALGIILGMVGFLRITVWSSFTDIYGPYWFLVAVTITCALFGVVLWGTIAGSMLPMALKRAGFDPAVASAPLVATLVDVTGIIIYFLIAMVVLKGTLL